MVSKAIYNTVEAPKQAHLAVVTEADGRAMAIPPGAVMYIIIDPTRPEKIIPLVLHKVTKKFIEFYAPTSDKTSTRKVRFVAQWSGDYKSPTKDAIQDGKETEG